MKMLFSDNNGARSLDYALFVNCPLFFARQGIILLGGCRYRQQSRIYRGGCTTCELSLGPSAKICFLMFNSRGAPAADNLTSLTFPIRLGNVNKVGSMLNGRYTFKGDTASA